MVRLKIASLVICFLYVQIRNTSAQTNILSGKAESNHPFNNQIEKVIKDFENALIEEENKMPPLHDNIHSVKKNLETLKKLIRTELQNAEVFQIDFVPQYELSKQVQIESWAHDSIERYQRAVRNFLSKGGYDLIGWEASALDTVTKEGYKKELLNNWKETDSNFKIDTSNFFERIAPQYMWQDGVLAYWVMNPHAKLTGLQETRLWKLNLEANRYDIPFSFYVSEFRSYVAMAKMIKAIRGNRSKQLHRAIIIMGAWHQTDVVMIAKNLGIKMKIITVTK